MNGLMEKILGLLTVLEIFSRILIHMLYIELPLKRTHMAGFWVDMSKLMGKVIGVLALRDRYMREIDLVVNFWSLLTFGHSME